MSGSITRWQLPIEIVKRSVASTWKQAVSEWDLTSVEFLAPGESTSCLCTHTPIRELCHIYNPVTQQRVIVGNVCIERFGKGGDESSEGAFDSVSKIMRAAKKILADPEASANKELIVFAKEKGVIRRQDAAFYQDIWRKRALSDKQLAYKRSLNLKILYQCIYSVKQAYHVLSSNLEGTAGPKLINKAYLRGVLTSKDKSFYDKVWAKRNTWLTPRQLKYKKGLNKRIVTKMEREFTSVSQEETKSNGNKKRRLNPPQVNF